MPLDKCKLVSGSTIVEVVTGLTIIALGVAFTIVVFSKTMDNSNLYVKHQAINAINELIVQQTKTMTYRPAETDSGDIRIICTATPFAGNDSLQILTYSATLLSSGKFLYKRRLIKKKLKNE